MTEIDEPSQHASEIWRTRALLLPLFVCGLCLAGVNIGADFLLALAVAPLWLDASESWREVYVKFAQLGWHICVIVLCVVVARAVIRRVEGKGSGILSQPSLSTAMFNDHIIFAWALLVLIATDLGRWAVYSFVDVGAIPTSSWFLTAMLALPALRLVGLAIERKNPALWPQIQARASRKARWPRPATLALLIALAVMALFVGILPRLV